MGIAMDAANALEAAIDAKIAKAAPKRTRATGTVARTDADGTSYVKLDGSDWETPVARTAAALKQGQHVGGTVSNGELVIDGNFSAPATDDSKALEAWEVADGAKTKAVKAGRVAADAMKVADEAGKVAEATEQHFWADTNGVHVTEAEGDATTEHNILMNSLGILLRKALNNLVSITASAISFFDGSGNTAQHVTASFGGSGANLYANGSLRQKIDTDGSHYYASDGTTEILEITTTEIPGYAPMAEVHFPGYNAIYADENGITMSASVYPGSTGATVGVGVVGESGVSTEAGLTSSSDGTTTVYAGDTVIDISASDNTVRTTGSAIVENTNSYFNRDGANPSSALYGKDYRITDKDGERVAFMRANRLADGTMQMQLNVCNENTSGTEVTNYLILGINRSGTRTVQFAESAPWRTALGLGALFKTASASKAWSSNIAAGGTQNVTVTFTVPSGYTIAAIRRVSSGNANVDIAGFYISGSTVVVALHNATNSARSSNNGVTVDALLAKSIFVG